jgi:hypothetical protein
MQRMKPIEQAGETMKFKHTPILCCILLVLVCLFSASGALHAQNFTGPELLARPTNTSVTVHVVVDTALQVRVRYGTTSGTWTSYTTPISSTANEPVNVVISGLSPNTQYYYQLGYSTDGGSTWTYRSRNPERSFYTQRAQGSTFTFSVTSDSHVNIMLGSAATWKQTLTNVGNDYPDFLIDLGDTFAVDNVTLDDDARTAYFYQRNSTDNYFPRISHSVPIFLAPGNHEQEEGWHISDPAGAVAVWCTNARKRYFPNPVPDAFYSGNTGTYAALDGDQLHEDYYAWNWGDVLFVVIDPFWYTTTKPFTGNTGGGEGSDTGSGNRWDWTLGKTQYDWLRQVLTTSNAKYKFVFAHQMVGGGEDYGHGGANSAHLVEWGGYNEAGTTYEFTTRRSGWYAPIHQVLVENSVSAFFHGHDHQYGYEKRDGVVYQSLPAAGFSGNGFGYYTTGNGYTIRGFSPSPAGHLRVTVTPAQATVDYVVSSGGGTNYSYIIDPHTPPAMYGDTEPDCDVDGTDIAEYITAGGYPGNMELFAANLGKTACQ